MRQRGLWRTARSRIGRTVFEGARVVGGWVRDFGHAGRAVRPVGARGSGGRCVAQGESWSVDCWAAPVRHYSSVSRPYAVAAH
eukprot:3068117-Prymnesium_polylepis.1